MITIISRQRHHACFTNRKQISAARFCFRIHLETAGRRLDSPLYRLHAYSRPYSSCAQVGGDDASFLSVVVSGSRSTYYPVPMISGTFRIPCIPYVSVHLRDKCYVRRPADMVDRGVDLIPGRLLAVIIRQLYQSVAFVYILEKVSHNHKRMWVDAREECIAGDKSSRNAKTNTNKHEENKQSPLSANRVGCLRDRYPSFWTGGSGADCTSR